MGNKNIRVFLKKIHTNGDIDNIYFKTRTDDVVLSEGGSLTNKLSQIDQAIAGGGGSGHTIKNDGTAMTSRAGLNFIDHDISDDSDNNETDVMPHKITNAEFNEIMAIKPSSHAITVDVINRFDKANMYSTTEKIIGQWIDGKPLYQKTFDCGALPDNVNKEIPINISNIDKIIDVSGISYGTAGNVISLPYVSTGIASDGLCVYIYNGNINLLTGAYYSDNYPYTYVTLKYTKTTDSAISMGTAYDYSSTEKVIGTWTDGKPVYQKTLTGTTGALNDVNTVGTISNIDTVVSINGIVIRTDGVKDQVPNNATSISVLQNGNVNIFTSNNVYVSTPVTATILYTKTTD